MDISVKEKQEQVKKILLTPIICDKKCNKTVLKEGIIYTGQTYYSTADEDMSDFAVGFYNILYSNCFAEDSLLSPKGKLNNCCFAGDTMNSFNSIAKLVDGKTAKQRGLIYNLPDDLNFLKIYYGKYHCLANFWILPMCIGRRSPKMNRYDSMHIFLNMLNDDYEILKSYKAYYEYFSSYKNFCEKNFVKCYSLSSTAAVKKKYLEKAAEELISTAIQEIENRAEDISKSEYSKDLWNYFFENDLY
jgi:hypothetical protein